MNTKDFEIMAPVGSFESLQAAIQAGADSVYFGVEQLNMRAHSANHFTVDDLRDIAATCNEHGMKSYLTVNTIIYGEDIDMMHTIIDAAHEAGVSAVIASDVAVMQYCRRVGVEVHLSTQLNISNIEALRFYAQFADVVVLARELRLEQVADIYRQVQEQNICGPSGQQVRIEMFCHGALCMAVSGKCYMSLDAANRSANRGECIQVCRRSYTATDNETGYQLEIDNKYIMSPKDLKTIRFIDRLMNAGVRVFKIEGRARGPEYVYTVVKCYKEAIAAVLHDEENDNEKLFTEERKDEWDSRLATVFNRGFWDGYYQGQLMGEWNKNYGSNATERKVYIGKGVKYFSRLGVAEFTVDAATFRLGDKLLVTGPTTGVMYLTATEIHDNDGNPVEEAPQGTRIAIPVTAKVRPSDKLFKLVKSLCLLLGTLTSLFFASCTKTVQYAVQQPSSKSIVILYENDVHCGIDGYTKLAGLRDAINASDTAYAAAVSCGDYLQGGTSGAISRGQYIVDIMRHVGYDAVTLGNHEFDYGVPHMKQLLSTVNAPVVCANFYDADAPKSYYPPYVIKQFGDKRIAFVGAVTPETMILENYAFYDDKGKLIYDLRRDDFISLIQKAVDEARQAGADYVVLLSHVGEQTQSMGFDSHRLIAGTKGIDVVLDGHSHSVIIRDQVTNLDNKTIGITQTGTQFAYVGKLLIKDGRFTTSLIPAKMIYHENARVTTTTDSVKTLMNEIVNKVVCTSDYPLVVTNENDVYIVRCMETNAGDLATDAYRKFTNADIALENGGGLRNDVPAGNITYGDITALSPYDQQLYKIEATGAQIVEALRQSTALMPEPDGNFPQCSGLKYTIHSASHTVSDVTVLDRTTGQYVAIDPARTYTVALSAYYKGGGFNNVLKDCTPVAISTTLTRDVIATFMKEELGGKLGDTYATPQGRITIVND